MEMKGKAAKLTTVAFAISCLCSVSNIRSQQQASRNGEVQSDASGDRVGVNPETQNKAAAPQSRAASASVSIPRIYLEKCASCHGPQMKGGLSSSILEFVRYHTNDEIIQVLRDKDSVFRTSFPFGRYNQMPTYQLSETELRELLAEMRGLAGTNTDMATGGFTGRSFQWGGASGFGMTWLTPAEVRSQGPKGPIPDFEQREASLNLTTGQKLQGRLMAQTKSDAELLSPDGNYHLLARMGDQYFDKPIKPASNWLSYHGNDSGNRYSTLDKINTENAQKLAVAWRFPMSVPRLQATPLVVDGIMYVTGWNELYALDATTGSPIWSYHESRTPGILGEAGRGANRGVAISGNQVFFLTDSGRLVAFNRLTGKKLWDVTTGSIENSVMASSAPLVAGNVVILGVGGGEEGVRGFLDAYFTASGKHAWRFYTIPTRRDKWATTWVGAALEHGCGATWMTGSYDPQLDLVYWGVGNPCPDFNGYERLGDNLYTGSVVALSAKTGTLKWHFQFTPHDTHDWDSTQSMVLVNRQWEGHQRKLLLHADKNGYFYVLDRETGNLLMAKPFASKVTWTTGYDKQGRPMLTPGWEASSKGTPTCPESATNWIDPSFDPQNNLFYVRVSDSCGIFTAGEDPLTQDRWYGVGKPSPEAMQGLKQLLSDYRTGDYVRAIDISTGQKRWEYRDQGRTGVLSTAGGVVFIGGQNGLTVLNAKTGEEIADVDSGVPQTAPPIFAPTPMTYMVGGKQYIVLPGQSTVVSYALSNSMRNPNLKEVSPTRDGSQPVTQPGGTQVNPAKIDFPNGPGKETFLKTCGTCHSPDNVIGKAYTGAVWKQVISVMVQNGAQATDEQFAAILKYLTTNFGAPPEKININSATVLNLINWLGLTPEQAQAVVTFREEHGNFKSLDDLEKVPGVNPNLWKLRRDHLAF